MVARYYKNSILNPFLIIILIIAASNLTAATFLKDNRVFIPRTDTLDDDLYMLASDGIINGHINHDLVALVQQQTITGVIGGSLMSGSFNSIIKGEIKNSANIFAYKLYIDGTINNNLNAFAYEIDISPGSRIGRDVALQASEISIGGLIERNLYIKADRVIIAGKIMGHTQIEAKEITISSPAEIMGDIYYTSPNEILIDEDVNIHGEIDWNETSQSELSADGGIDWGDRIFFMFAALLTGLVIIPIFNKHTKTSAMQIIEKPLVSLGIGFLAFCLAPFAIAVIFVTIVGIPVSIMLTLVYSIFFYIAKIYTAIALGWVVIRAFRKGAQPKQGWSLAVGLVLLMLLFAIPILGWILYFVTIFFGFGAIIIGVNKCRIDMAGNSQSN